MRWSSMYELVFNEIIWVCLAKFMPNPTRDSLKSKTHYGVLYEGQVWQFNPFIL